MMKQYIIQKGNESQLVQVVYSGRKSIGLEVKQGGIVIARAPYRLPDKELISFIEKHQSWIWEKLDLSKQKQEERKQTGATAPGELTKEETQKILDKFSARVRYWAGIMGITYGRITIRNQKTRWGSCSSKGNLNFNYQLYYLPENLMDYVIIHELAHRRHMDHSAGFWKEVEKYCPDYKTCRKTLKEYHTR